MLVFIFRFVNEPSYSRGSEFDFLKFVRGPLLGLIRLHDLSLNLTMLSLLTYSKLADILISKLKNIKLLIHIYIDITINMIYDSCIYIFISGMYTIIKITLFVI